MASLENMESAEAGENHSVGFEECDDSEYLVNESEAREINSCLNFLSILDEETSNDSCEFTLFRKKDDHDPLSNIETDETKDMKHGDDANIEKKVTNGSVEEEKKKNIGAENIVEAENFESIKTTDSIKTNNTITPDPKPQTNESPNFKVTSVPCSEVFRISTISDKLVPLSKEETSSMLRSAKVIVLKVPRLASTKSNLANKNENLSYSEKQNVTKSSKVFSKVNMNSNWLKFENTRTSLPNPVVARPLNTKSIQTLEESQRVIVNDDGSKKTFVSVKNVLIPSLESQSFTNISNWIKKKKEFRKKEITKAVNGKKLLGTGENDKPINEEVSDYRPINEEVSDRPINEEVSSNIKMKQEVNKDVMINSSDSGITSEVNRDQIGLGDHVNTDHNPCHDVPCNVITSPLEISQITGTASNNAPEKPDSQYNIEEVESFKSDNHLQTQLSANQNALPLETESVLEAAGETPRNTNSIPYSSQEMIHSSSDQLNPKKLVNENLYVHRQESQKDSSKKVRTRVLDGAKYKKLKKKDKMVDLLKYKKLPQRSPHKWNILKDKYKPLIRTELPTFLHRLESDPSENSKQNGSGTEPSAFRKQKINGKRKFNKRIEQEKDRLSILKRVICEENNEVNGMKYTETFESISFPPILPDKMRNLPWTSEDDLTFIDSIKDSFSAEEKGNLEETSAFLNFNTYQHESLEPASNFTDNCNITDDDQVNSFSSKEIVMQSGQNLHNIRDLNHSKDLNPLAILVEDGGSLHPADEGISQFNVKDQSKEADLLEEMHTSGTSMTKETSVNENILLPNTEGEVQNSLELIEECNDEMEEQSENYTYITQKSSAIIYSFNKSSPLSFSVQNILENMFKYESFPSSSNMNTLAKLMEVQWRDVRDWFVARRNLNKKNGIFPRNQPLLSCPFCPEYQSSPDHNAIMHILHKDHIQNMLKSMHKDHLIFSKFQNEVESKERNGETGFLHSTSIITEPHTKLYNSRPSLNDIFSEPGSENERVIPLSQNFEGLSNSKEKKIPIVFPFHPEMGPESKTKGVYIALNDFDKAVKDQTPICKELDASHFRDENGRRRRTMKSLRQIETNIYIGYRCPECSKIFQSEWMLIKHSISHKKLICFECNEVFLREELLHHHVKEHLIESMDDELYSMYICLKCYSLDCICLPETHYLPPTRDKYYIRPQTAKRSKPFLSAPHSGVNEHLKVTVKEFWHEFSSLGKATPSNKERRLSSPVNFPTEGKTKINVRIGPNVTPTYTNITTFNCDMCESFFFTQDELREHIIVHRIQSRSRDKKKREEEKRKDLSESEFLKPNAPLNPLYFCSYCVKGYKRESTLYKHLKLECKALPKHISQQLLSGTSFLIEKVGKTRHYKVKLTHTHHGSLLMKPSKTRCHRCSLVLSKYEYLKHVCSEDKIEDNNSRKGNCENKSGSENRLEPSELEGKKTEHYFLCSFCNIPMTSERQLHLHIQMSCSKAPKEVKSELYSHTLSELVKLGKGIYFKKIHREALSEVLSPRKLRFLLDISTFQVSKSNYKRVKCKFCDKIPLKTSVKLHLFHCKSIPEEFRAILSANRNLVLGKNWKVRPQDKKSKASVVPASLSISESDGRAPAETNVAQSDQEEVWEATTTTTTTTATTTTIKKGLRPTTETNMLYDCHLCEEKFKISKDFISHMSSFHCLKISEGASYKWLSVISRIKADSASRNEKESPIKSPESRGHLENVIEQDATLENIAETLLVSDVTNLGCGNEFDSVESLTASEKRKENSSLLMGSPSKSQKMDDEELLGDLDNLDNFIETVQLEDSSFVNSATS